MIKLNIDSHEIPINQKLMFLQGNYDINTIENLPYSWIDWNENLEILFRDSDLLIEFFSRLNSIITHQNSKKIGLISDIWRNLYSTLKENKNNIAKYEKFNELSKNLRSKSNLLQDIERLELMEKNLDQMVNQSIFQSKKDLLLKLEKLLVTQTTEFNIQSDEFFVNKQRVDENLAIITKFDNNLSRLKQEQRILFKETNELTKQMDSLEPLMNVYQEKLEVIDSYKNGKDYNRIKKKFEDIVKEHEDCKNDRVLKIKKSKDITQKMRNLRVQIKKNNNDLRKLDLSKFNEIKKNYEDLKTDLENTKTQITSVRLEIDSMLNNSEKNVSQNDLNQDDMFYSNPTEIKEQLKKKRNLISQINDFFENTYDTTDLEIIKKKIDADRRNLLDELTSNSEKLQLSSEKSHYYEDLLKRIKEIQSWMNKFLSKIDMKISFSLAFDKENLKLTNKIMKKNQYINFNTDLKRIEKAFFYFSAIISSYLGENYRFIPIRINKLPKFMITKQNFIKNIKMLDDMCEELPEDINIIFFLEENKFEIPLEIIKID
ncbi:hypothetical protein DSAG12_00351 [Promethearchaeum syntrophicum]|uniref:Uncharacterized protein n=1 Tax=Promethearchaeum syntrophicum TaxID=2594042 RepID=A0A5B9D5X7_9ARCH|nr:hypothetical protein [Candidatus Prometheoarchaeum syntrophicum]QEE14538.1 hypothetical protein DSAG12_00351 [Candidatus Prometheoarchaeum syntrophicum]